MNVYYIGVDNPITVSVNGLSSKDVEISVFGAGGGNLSCSGAKCIVNVTQQTPREEFCNINITNAKTGKRIGTFPFRVKKLPDPSARLLNYKFDGLISYNELKIQTGIVAVLENFDFEAKFKIVSYKATFYSKGLEPKTIFNEGASFSDELRNYIESVKSGDTIIFTDVKCNCPGDLNPRKLNPLAFQID